MANVWANFMACHLRATCHIAECKNSIRHRPIGNRFSSYFILFYFFLKCNLGFDERRLLYRLRDTCLYSYKSWKRARSDSFIGRNVVFLSSRYHFSVADFNSGQASRLTNTISCHHRDTVSDTDLYAVNFATE